MRLTTWRILFFGLLCSAQGFANHNEAKLVKEAIDFEQSEHKNAHEARNVPVNLPRGRSGYNEAPESSNEPTQASSAGELLFDGRSGYNKAHELIPTRRVPRGRSGYNDVPQPSDEARVAVDASTNGRSGYNKARQEAYVYIGNKEK
ncbi:hypothetical protein N0V88_006309 [Collariella sp. IMI 366227]|nr:hypothetical protein N0V88_006309 [Collariella sp. IMI 366227]